MQHCRKYKSLHIQRKERPDDDPEIKRVETCCPILTDIKEHQKQLCFDWNKTKYPKNMLVTKRSQNKNIKGQTVQVFTFT